MSTFLWVLFGLWALFNWAAPFAVLVKAERLGFGRLPMELLSQPQTRKVRFYLSHLRGGYGYSIWAPPWHIVVFDKAFFQRASPGLVRYVVAHEIAHFTLGHHRKRWFAVVSGLILIPSVRRWLLRMEDEADELAGRRVGVSRKHFPELREVELYHGG